VHVEEAARERLVEPRSVEPGSNTIAQELDEEDRVQVRQEEAHEGREADPSGSSRSERLEATCSGRFSTIEPARSVDHRVRSGR